MKNKEINSNLKFLTINYLLPLATFIFFILLWELIVILSKIPPYIIPAPSIIFKKLIYNIDELIFHTSFTLWETITGFFFALLLGVPLAVSTAFSKFLRETFYPVVITLEMIPKIAFAPVIIIWFGLGIFTKLVIVFLVCFFPIIINGIFGFNSLEKEYEWFIVTTGSSKIKAFFKIRLPAALPSLFIGIKGAAINATIGATIAEWVGGNRGLGYFIQKSTGNFRTADSIAAIILLTIVGLLLYWAVTIAEKILIPWHQSQRKQEK